MSKDDILLLIKYERAVLFLRKRFNREERKAFSPLLHCLRNLKGVLLFFTDTSSGRKKAGKKYQDVVSRETCLIVCNRFSAEVRKKRLASALQSKAVCFRFFVSVRRKFGDTDFLRSFTYET